MKFWDDIEVLMLLGIFKLDTVWLFSFVTFHDDVIQKVIKIIEFGKKLLKDDEITFYDV